MAYKYQFPATRVKTHNTGQFSTLFENKFRMVIYGCINILGMMV